MSLKVKSNWRIAVNAVGLAGSLSQIGLYLWAGLARNRWHWGFILLWAFWGFILYPVNLLRELKKPKEFVPVNRHSLAPAQPLSTISHQAHIRQPSGFFRGREFTGPFCV
jgi:hypothetical protein